jgi:hypothetical protein
MQEWKNKRTRTKRRVTHQTLVTEVGADGQFSTPLSSVPQLKMTVLEVHTVKDRMAHSHTK